MIGPRHQLMHGVNLLVDDGTQFTALGFLVLIIHEAVLTRVKPFLHLFKAFQRAVKVGLEHLHLVLPHLQLAPVLPQQEGQRQQPQGQQGSQEQSPTNAGFILDLVQLRQLDIIFLLHFQQAMVQPIDGDRVGHAMS